MFLKSRVLELSFVFFINIVAPITCVIRTSAIAMTGVVGLNLSLNGQPDTTILVPSRTGHVRTKQNQVRADWTRSNHLPPLRKIPNVQQRTAQKHIMLRCCVAALWGHVATTQDRMVWLVDPFQVQLLGVPLLVSLKLLFIHSDIASKIMFPLPFFICVEHQCYVTFITINMS